MKLEEILALITDQKIMLKLLKDLTTPKELKSLQERLDIVFLLNEGLSYVDISQQIGVSTTTITRVSRFLKQEKNGGYRWLINNLNSII